MKRKLLQITCLCLSIGYANAQNSWNSANAVVWNYDLNANRAEMPTAITGVTQEECIWHKTGNATVTTTSTNGNPQWFPEPSGASTYVQVRTGSAAILKYTLVKDEATELFKSLKIDASNTTGKFIIRDIDATKAQPAAKFSFRLKTHYKDGDDNVVNPGYVRDYYVIFGHNTGTSSSSEEGSFFRDANSFPAQNVGVRQSVFTSLRLSYKVNDPAMEFAYRKVVTAGSGTGSGTHTSVTVPVPFDANGTDSYWEVYCNNSNMNQYYVVSNEGIETIGTVLPHTFHLFINNNKIGEYDIANTGVTTINAGKIMNSFMIFTTGTSAETTELGYGSIELSDFKVDYVQTTGSTLPISLSSFTGSYLANVVKLNWTTLSEKDNSHFEVLRSHDGVSFQEIAKVKGAGDSSNPVNYSVTDYNPLQGVNYYQLKQIDYNGKSFVSDVIAVNSSLTKSALTVVKKDNGIEGSVYATGTKNAKLSVTDINGSIVYTKNLQLSGGENKFYVETSRLSSGVYVVSVENDGQVKRVRFLN